MELHWAKMSLGCGYCIMYLNKRPMNTMTSPLHICLQTIGSSVGSYSIILRSYRMFVRTRFRPKLAQGKFVWCRRDWYARDMLYVNRWYLDLISTDDIMHIRPIHMMPHIFHSHIRPHTPQYFCPMTSFVRYRSIWTFFFLPSATAPPRTA